MANRTDPLARAVHGTNPQNLIENIVRQRIYEQMFWKEECFALTADTVLEKAVELRCVGGTYGGQRRATEFLCLVLKLLQLQPEKDIVYEYIANEDFKYVRLLGAFYLRLIGTPKEIYEYLEPLYHDFRKVRQINPDGTYSLLHMDEAVQALLSKDALFDTSLPHLPYRHVLESAGRLKPRQSVFQEDFEETRKQLEKEKAERDEELRLRKEQNEILEEDEKEKAADKRRQWQRGKMQENFQGSKNQSREPRDRHRHRDRDRDRDRSPGYESGEYDNRRRQRSRSPEYRRGSGGGSRRDYDGERSRDRSSHHRGRRDRSPSQRSRPHDYRDRVESSRSRKRSRSPPASKSDKRGNEKGEMNKDDLAIAEANALRAKLGLKPLKM